MTAMGNTAAFGLASFITGLFCARLSFALIGGALLALGYATLVLIGLRDILADADMPYLLGMLTAACLAIFLPAIVGCYLSRGVSRPFRRRQSPI